MSCKQGCPNKIFRAGLCNRHYRAAPHPLALLRRRPCDLCRGVPETARKVLTFGLSRSKVNGSRARSMGSIRLCEECWLRTAAPRRVPQRRNKAAA